MTPRAPGGSTCGGRAGNRKRRRRTESAAPVPFRVRLNPGKPGKFVAVPLSLTARIPFAPPVNCRDEPSGTPQWHDCVQYCRIISVSVHLRRDWKAGGGPCFGAHVSQARARLQMPGEMLGQCRHRHGGIRLFAHRRTGMMGSVGQPPERPLAVGPSQHGKHKELVDR